MLRVIRPLFRTALRARSVHSKQTFPNPYDEIIARNKIPPKITNYKFTGPGSLTSIVWHGKYYRVENLQTGVIDPTIRVIDIDTLFTEKKLLELRQPAMQRMFDAMSHGIPSLSKPDVKPRIKTDMENHLREGLLNAQLSSQRMYQIGEEFLSLMFMDEFQLHKLHDLIRKDPSQMKKSVVLLHKFALRAWSLLNSYEMAQQEFIISMQKIIKSHTHFMPQGDYFDSYISIYTIAQTSISRTLEKIRTDLNELEVYTKKEKYDQTDRFMIIELFGEWREYLRVRQKSVAEDI